MTSAPSASSASQRAGILVLGKILATLSEALVPLVVVRLLGKADVGVLSSSLLLYSTVALVCSAGLPETVTFFLPTRTLAERGAIARLVARTSLGLGVVAGVVLLLLSVGSRWLGADAASANDEVAPLRHLWLLALYPIGELPARLLPNLLVAEGQAGSAARFGVFKALGSALAALVPLALGASVPTVLLSISLFGLAYGGCLLWTLHGLYAKAERVPSPVAWREVLRFGFPLGLTDIVSLLNNQLDRYLIFMLLPITALADYQVGAWQIPVISTIAYAVGAAYAPDLVAAFQQGKAHEAMQVWRTAALKVALIVVPFTLVFMVAAEEVIALLFTADYVAAANVFRCFTFLTLGRIATFGSLLVAAGRPGLVVRAAAFTLISNVLLSVPLALALGFIGPALGTALAFIPMVVYYCMCISDATGVGFTYTFPLLGYLRILGIGLVAAAPAVWFKSITPYGPLPSLLIIAGLVLGAFALLGSLTRVIRGEDWRYASRWLRMKFS